MSRRPVRAVTWSPGIARRVARGLLGGAVVGNNRAAGIVAGGFSYYDPATQGYLLPAPTILPAAGTIAFGTAVSIRTTVLGGRIFFTTNGSTPTASSPEWPGTYVPPGSSTITVKAVVVKDGATSPVASSTFVVAAPSLIDQTKILGAWNFGVGAYSTANLVIGSKAGTFDYKYPAHGLATPASATGYAAFGQGSGASTNVDSGCQVTGGVSSTDFSIAFMFKGNVGGSSLFTGDTPSFGNYQFSPNHSGATFRLGSATGAYGSAVLINDGAFHHYAMVMSGLTWRLYRDGTLLSSGALTGTATGFTPIQVILFGVWGVNTNVWDNMIITQEAISAAAVTSLAAGNMPDSTGYLS